jgi:hypothetical protein
MYLFNPQEIVRLKYFKYAVFEMFNLKIEILD